MAIEEPFLGLAEYSTHLIKACLLRDEFNIIMVVNRSDIVAFKKCHQKMGINSGVEYISFDDLTTANQLSFVLLFFILLLFVIENLSRKGAKYHQNTKGNKP